MLRLTAFLNHFPFAITSWLHFEYVFSNEFWPEQICQIKYIVSIRAYLVSRALIWFQHGGK